jgi:peptidoglycan/xylan/chitin deacetylase (PgdA/CDA1 family)
MHFCIRDDDTSFFTSPDDLERVYGEVTRWGPVSLAVVPFHRAGTSKGVPERFRGRWSVHPLDENRALVDYLRAGVSAGRFEIMLHGYYHDERHGRPEFDEGDDLARRVIDGRRYLEELLGTTIRVFVPPRNGIGRKGLHAIALSKLHLAGTAGIRRGWSPLSGATWALWWRLRRWRTRGGLGVPWILDLGDHREIPGNAVTPVSHVRHNEAVFESTLASGGVFCAATHYWEQSAASVYAGEPTVGEQLQRLIDRAASNQRIVWRSVGDVVSAKALSLS